MKQAEKTNVTVSPDHLRLLQESVEAGDYASTRDALNDAMRLWQKKRQDNAAHLDTIRARIRASLDDPRPSLTHEEVEARIDALHRETVKSLQK